MPLTTTCHEPPEFDVGHRVITTEPIDAVPDRVPVGSHGVVIARTAGRLIAVRFDTGQVEYLHPRVLAAERAAP